MTDVQAELDELRERLARLEDERAVVELMHQYVHACDVIKDADTLSGFFSPDGVWEGQGNLAEFRAEGRDEIREMFVDNPSMLPFTAHFLTNPVVELSADRSRGRGRWHALEAATFSDGETAVWMMAYYNNDFVKCEGEWRIAHLRFEDRAVFPHEDGWAVTRYVSPVTLERFPQPRGGGPAGVPTEGA